MVQLFLFSPKGNQAVRHFPYHGYLGLTPLQVEGVVRTKMDDDGKLLQAKSISVSVRCYESRIGRFNTIQTNRLVDFTQVLWSKPVHDEWAEIGDSEFPFRISIPVTVGGHSTANLQDYRVWWRVEAAMTHVPLGTVGCRQVKHFDLPFIRFDIPPSPSTPTLPSYLAQQTTKPRAPTIRYRVFVPTTSVGPHDLVSVPISLQPLEHTVSIRSASLIVERRIQLHESNNNNTSASSSTLSSTLPIPIASTSSSCSSRSQSQSQSAPSSYATLPDVNASTETMNINLSSYSSPSSTSPSPAASTIFSSDSESARPLLPQNQTPPPLSPLKTITNSVAGVESSGRFPCDDEGVWTKTLTFQWPSAKSSTRWAMGETMQTELASIKFFVRVKIVISSPSGTESIDLEEQELHVVSTNDTERQIALAKYNELLDVSASASASSNNNNGTDNGTPTTTSTRAKSKSPRRIRHKREPLPSPPAPQSPPPNTNIITDASHSSFSATPSITTTRHSVIPSNFTPPAPKSATHAEHGHAHKSSLASSLYPTSMTKTKNGGKKIPRRPHTSAGPRDTSNEFRREPNWFERKQQPQSTDATNHLCPRQVIAARSEVVVDSGGGVAALTTALSSFVRKKTLAPPRLSPSGNSSIHSFHDSENVPSPSPLPSPLSLPLPLPEAAAAMPVSARVENELAKIEVQSRRSSMDILGIFKRKRVFVDRDG